jgi:bla regulator protein blaR1
MYLLFYIFILTITGSMVYLLFKGIEQVTKRFFNATWHYNLLKCIVLLFCIPIGKFHHLFVDGSLPRQNMGIIADYAGRVSRYTAVRSRLVFWILCIWLLGIVVVLLKQLICYIRFRYIVSYNNKSADALHQWVVIKSAEKLGIKKAFHLYINEYINTPMLMGLFSPIILLPSDKIVQSNLEYIVSHELTHYRSKDLIIKFFTMVIRTMHWFNPAVYLMSRDIDKWCEYACDERNAINLPMEKKKKYGVAILDAAAIMPIYGANFGTPFLLPKQNLRERLLFMLNVKRMSRKSTIFAFVVSVILLLSGFITATAGEVGRTSNVQSDSTLFIYSTDINSSNYNVSTLPLDQDKQKSFSIKQ